MKTEQAFLTVAAAVLVVGLAGFHAQAGARR